MILGTKWFAKSKAILILKIINPWIHVAYQFPIAVVGGSRITYNMPTFWFPSSICLDVFDMRIVNDAYCTKIPNTCLPIDVGYNSYEHIKTRLDEYAARLVE